MPKRVYLIIFILIFIASVGEGQILDERVTTQANVGLTINNLGLIGNAFRGSYTQKNYPSCEYPVGSSIEHMFQGGLWVGAYKSSRRKVLNPTPGGVDSVLVKNLFGPYVSTAAFDAPSGYSAGSRNFEFTSVSPGISEKSSLPQNQTFQSNAISHQDFSTEFTDKNIFIPGSGNPPRTIPDHTNPLGLNVKLETYNWNFSFANFFVILNYRITNTGVDTLDSLHVGQYYNAVVRNVSRVTPSGTAFFNKGGNGYLDSLRMGYVFDATGDPGFTESYVGIKFLGAEKFDKKGKGLIIVPGKKKNSRFKVNFQTWLFGSSDPKFFPPPNDPERFGRMATGLQYEDVWDAQPPIQSTQKIIKAPGNRTNVLSCGSLQTLAPGESVNVAFALICAKKDNEENLPNTENTAIQQRNLFANGLWAQTAFNGEDLNGDGILSIEEDLNGDSILDRYILPSPPDVPNTKVIAGSNSIDVYWSDNSENSIDPISKEKDFEGYKLYKSEFAFDTKPTIDLQNSLKLVGEWDKTGNTVGFNSGFSAVKLKKDTIFPDSNIEYKYKFSFPKVQNGWQHVIALTAFDRGSNKNNLGPLETALKTNQFMVFPGTTPNPDIEDNPPFVYPDPYYSGSAWSGSSTKPEDGKLYFANLPARCDIKIFSAAGDLIDEFTHDASTYQGSESWFKTYSTFSQDPLNPDKRVFSGGEHDWNLLSKDSQIISRGLYLFSVKDYKTGKIQTGKFTIIK